MRHSTLDGPGLSASPRPSSRQVGREVRALIWAGRHPGFVVFPAVLAYGLISWGWQTLTPITTGVLVAVIGWGRVHPRSFDRFAAPRLRTTWRRWTAYRGARWARLLTDCELTREHRSAGRLLVPRLLRVRSITHAVDVLRVRMIPGQSVKTWIEHADVLADALGAHRVAITRSRPGVLVIVVERREAFARTLDAPVIPDSPTDVDLRALDVGDTEYGAPFLLRVLAVHLLVAGASGSGKGSWMWGPLRALGPLIRIGWVRVWMVDLKGGVETERGARLYHRYATTPLDALALLEEYRDELTARKDYLRTHKMRRAVIGRDTPFELLVIDEVAMLTAYSKREVTGPAVRLLSEIMTQGRAGLFAVWAYVQEPTKDVLDIRELFTLRICLAVTAASHVDMVLGDGARERGALADEIPTDDDHAGIGFYIEPITRRPIRVRAGFTADRDIDELVDLCAPGQPEPHGDLDPGEGEVIPFPDQSHANDPHSQDGGKAS